MLVLPAMTSLKTVTGTKLLSLSIDNIGMSAALSALPHYKYHLALKSGYVFRFWRFNNLSFGVPSDGLFTT
jgi:hypothetical protein